MPSVIGRLEERARALGNVPHRHTEPELRIGWIVGMSPSEFDRRTAGSDAPLERPTVVALIFAPPGSEPMRQLVERGEYFDSRSGDVWDLFFPGYSRYAPEEERAVELGPRDRGSWYWNPTVFDDFRRSFEERTGWTYKYSGEAELVLLNAWLASDATVTIDWESVQSGPLTSGCGRRTLSLGEVIERISQDQEDDSEDPFYGVGAIIGTSVTDERGAAREVGIHVAGATIAEVILRILGLR